jgi:hypothetical protein
MLFRNIVLMIVLSILVALTGCNADNNQPGTDPNQGADNQPKTPGTNQEGAGMEGGANEGFDAQDFRPLYRRGDTDSDWRGGRFFSFNRDDQDLDSRRLKEESNVFSSALGFSDYTANNSRASYQGFGSQTYTIDRQLLADLIGQTVVGLPDVERASVLVTDQHCLIGYTADDTNQNMDQQISKSADSVAPGWYKVYTTNDPRLTDHIRQIARQYNGKADLKNLTMEVNALIEQMGGPDRNDEGQINEQTDRNGAPQDNFDDNRKTDNFHRQGNINQQ